MVWIVIIAFIIVCLAIIKANSYSNHNNEPKRPLIKTELTGQKGNLEWNSQNKQRIYGNKQSKELSHIEKGESNIDTHKTFITQDECSKFYTEPSHSPIIGNWTGGSLRLDGKDDKPVGISNYPHQDYELSLSTWEDMCSKKGVNPLDELITDVYFEVKGIYYRDNEAIEAARTLSKGNNLYLEPEPDNPYDGNALKILTENNIFIGYVDRDCCKIFKERNNVLISCKVQKVKKNYDIPYVHVVAKYKGSFDIYGEDVRCVISRTRDYIKSAMRLKDKEEFEKAADKFIYAGQHEVFEKFQLEAYRNACICLRKIKDYKREIDIINIILEQFSNELYDDKKETFEKRLVVAMRLKESAERRKNRLRKKMES